MFVINTSESSWFQNASVSWQMDVDLYWWNYVMYPTTNPVYYMPSYCCLYTNNNWQTWGWTEFFVGWNWKCPGSCSFFKCFKANDIDHDVLFPYNYICSWWNRRQFTAGWCSQCSRFINYYLWLTPTPNQVYCGCETDIMSGWLLRRTMSRKVFEWWEMVGKKIEWYLRMYQDAALAYMCYYHQSYWWCVAVNSCPFCIYTDIWLMHEDWTKCSLVYCANSLPYGHINTASGYMNVNWCSQRTPNNYIECCIINVLPWILETDWLIAEAWDRLYIEFWTTEDSRIKYEYKTNCNAYNSFAVSWSFWPYIFSLLSWSPMCNPISWFTNNDSCLRNMCLYDCNWNTDVRYPWIKFSIE